MHCLRTLPRILVLTALLLPGAAACGDEGAASPEPTPTPDVGPSPDTGAQERDGTAGPEGTTPPAPPPNYPADPPEVVGEAVDRPATVYRPADYTPDRAWPLVLLLHGFGASGFIQNGYLGVSTWVDELGFVLVVPDGTQNPEGQRFWNGTQACCGFGVATVDDVSYLRGLVEETSTLYHIDPTRVYSMGHSNGGFMSFRLACEASDVFVAVASLAGASYADAADCQPAERPVSVLQVHGTQDDTIRYEGGQLFGQPYPSAADTVALHAAVAGCDEAGVDGEPLNMEVNLPGAETTTRTWTQGCAEGTTMALWTIERGSHIPVIGGAGTEAMLRWLLARSR